MGGRSESITATAKWENTLMVKSRSIGHASRKTRLSMSSYVTATAIGSLIAVAASGSAQAAPAYAYASLAFANFQLSGLIDSSGTPTVPLTNFTTSLLMQDGSNYPGAANGGATAYGDLASGLDIDAAYSGPGAAIGPNQFGKALTVGSGLSGTRGDGLISGALATGATSNLVAEGNLTLGRATAGSYAGSSTTITIGFTTATGLSIELSGIVQEILAASVGTDGDTASAWTNASFKIDSLNGSPTAQICDKTDTTHSHCYGNNVAPTEVNTPISIQTPGPELTYDSGAYSFDYVADLAAGSYVITLADNANELVHTAPEPVSLALFGTGLLALGITTRRRQG
jgi:hypothetical protein